MTKRSEGTSAKPSRADLAQRQQAFLQAIHDDRAPLPPGWGNRQAAGMAVYRGNYRSALMAALADLYERTALYVGDEAFRRASMHHIITQPPSGWTIDEAGAGFDKTCAQLFGDNPEVSELAWLEWTMRELASAPDTLAMAPADFAEAGAHFGDEEWANLRLALQPRAAARLVGHDCEKLWRALDTASSKAPDRSHARLASPQSCLVWREGERPTFEMVEADHAAAFHAVAGGANYAEMSGVLVGDDPDPAPQLVEQAAMRAGAILGRWLQEGLIVGLNP